MINSVKIGLLVCMVTLSSNNRRFFDEIIKETNNHHRINTGLYGIGMKIHITAQ